MRRLLAPAILLLLVACQSPEAAYFSGTAEPRVALVFIDQSPKTSGLGPEGEAAYRTALEERFGPRLGSLGPHTARLTVVVTGVREAAAENPHLERIALAAVARNPVGLALSLASLDQRTRTKLEDLGYPIRVPEASFRLELPEDRPSGPTRALDPKTLIQAHERLMHGDRGPDSRLRAEAQAFARSVEGALRQTCGWPPKSR